MNKDVVTAPESTDNGTRQLARVNLQDKELPNLEKLNVAPFDLMADYWTPESVGETKRLIFLEVRERTVIDEKSGDEFQLPCAFFLEEVEPKNWATVSNGSKRLVAALENRGVKQGTPLQIVYRGKVKNRTNAYKSDRWSIKPLLLEV